MSDPAYHTHHQQRRPTTGGSGATSLNISGESVNASELSCGSSFSSSSTSATSGVVSGEGSEASSSYQRLVVAASLAAGAGISVSREQGVRDLRSIIQ